MFRSFSWSSFISSIYFAGFCVCVFFVTSFCLSLRILALDFNSDFHEKFVSPGIEHAKNTAAIPHGSRFHQIIVHIFCFCFNNSLEQKPVATKYDSFLFFFFFSFSFFFSSLLSTSTLFRICLIFGALDFFLFLLLFFCWCVLSLIFAEKNG